MKFKNSLKKNGAIKKSDTNISVDKIPHTSFSPHVNVFSNKLKVVQHRARKKKYAGVAYHGLYDQKKLNPKIKSIFNKLSENIYFWGG